MLNHQWKHFKLMQKGGFVQSAPKGGIIALMPCEQKSVLG